MDKTKYVAVGISCRDAWFLAQLAKRIGWQEIRLNAIDEEEARDMVDAVARFRAELARVGFAPR